MIEVLKFHKFRIRNIDDGSERVTHWNHMKIIKGDIDDVFVKHDNNASFDDPVSLQDDDVAAGGYNLCSRKLRKGNP